MLHASRTLVRSLYRACARLFFSFSSSCLLMALATATGSSVRPEDARKHHSVGRVLCEACVILLASTQDHNETASPVLDLSLHGSHTME